MVETAVDGGAEIELKEFIIAISHFITIFANLIWNGNWKMEQLY